MNRRIFVAGVILGANFVSRNGRGVSLCPRPLWNHVAAAAITVYRTRATNSLGNVYHRRLVCESLENRCLLSVASPQIQLFDASPALFVENVGQWSDPAVRYAFQGSGANVLQTQTGPVIQLFQQREFGE